MPAAEYDLTIEQGTTFTRTLTLADAEGVATDLTGCTAAGKIRKKYSSTSAAATFTVAFAADRTTGELTFSLSAAQTAAIEAGESVDSANSQYVWDLEMTWADSTVDRILQGKVSISPEATK
jgi:hypothetical protein